ncbi:monocarboxylate transporter 14 isoform X1 [Hydra vulgaris]|uniref:monocarboxylate transporter 14 isoform X1 n=2 Tax=Hydra vulgaris TaxID=6087 RepID=UPI001F5EDA3D|nr:monocarboxylate transporter 14 isoform X1 [Hydra vulgaris]
MLFLKLLVKNIRVGVQAISTQELIGCIDTDVRFNMCSAKKNNFKTHPDGGWGWCVVVAAFITQFIVVGLQNSSGVIFNELVQKFNKPRGETGFVSSISVGMMFILGPFTTSLCQKFTCRRVSVLGGFLCILGMIASAYANTLELMYISFGVVWGLGTSFCYFPAMIVLVPYFDKRLPLVTGIVSSGSGFGTLVLSPFIQWFSHQYGVKNAFLMLAGLHGLVFFAGFVYKPVAKKYKFRQKNKNICIDSEDDNKVSTLHENSFQADEKRCLTPIKNKIKISKKRNFLNSDVFSLFKNKSYLAWCFGLSIFILGYFVPFVHLVRYAVLIGIPEVKSAFLISTLSISSTIFKLITGKLAGLKCVSKMQIYQFGLLTMGIGTTLIPISHSFYGLMVYCVVYGFGESVFIVMIPLITKDIVGVKKLPLALGCVFMIMGVPTTVGAPIAGWIYDYFNDYSYAFFVAGCMNVVGVLIMFLIDYFGEKSSNEEILNKVTKSWLKKQRKQYKHPESSSAVPFVNHQYFEPKRSIFYKDLNTNNFSELSINQTKENNTNNLDDIKYYLNLSDSSKKSIITNETNYKRHLLKRINETSISTYSNKLTLKKDYKKTMFSGQTFKKNIPQIKISCSSSKNSISKDFNNGNDHTKNRTSIIYDYYDHDKALIKVDDAEEILVVQSMMTAV